MAFDNGQSTEWATVTTGQAASDPVGAWAAALSGVALGVYIDRSMNAQQRIDSTDGYGINPDGSVYDLGRPAQAVQAPRRGGNDMMLLMLVIGFVLVSGKV